MLWLLEMNNTLHALPPHKKGPRKGQGSVPQDTGLVTTLTFSTCKFMVFLVVTLPLGNARPHILTGEN